MDSEIDFLFNGIGMLLTMYNLVQLSSSRNRRWAVRPANRDRESGGYYAKVYTKIKLTDPELFFSHTRMQPRLFDLLLDLVKEDLTVRRGTISAEERLALTILYLAHGVSIPFIALSFKLGRSTVRKIILEVTETLWKTLSPIYVSEPTEFQYSQIAEDFLNLWNMPNCCGAIDGKHFPIKCPDKSGSMFFNYKKFFSIVLLAACDAKYTFTSISVGSYGSESDGGIFRNSSFGKSLSEDKIPIPPSKPLPNTTNNYNFPHFFVADAAFPLRHNLMRPYPGQNLSTEKQIFNYRLSRARRTVENTFGILTSRWRVLRSTMEWAPENAERIILACIALHNFIILNDARRWYCSDGYVDWESADHIVHGGEWRSDAQNPRERNMLQAARGRSTVQAFELRDRLAAYFMYEGAVPFQNRF